MPVFTDEYFMKQALQLAQQAFEAGEVPIGAVVVSDNQVIGKGYNQVEALRDATAHAEMIAISAASEYLGTKFLTECTLYVTIEPCPMCAGGLYWARLGKVVYGAREPKFGFNSREFPILHPKTVLEGGLLEFECKEIMQRFFLEKRK
jgi:tRNA(adenine34) deaminase